MVLTTIGIVIGYWSYRYQSVSSWLPAVTVTTATYRGVFVVKSRTIITALSQYPRTDYDFRGRTYRFRVRCCEYRTRRLPTESRVDLLLFFSSHVWEVAATNYSAVHDDDSKPCTKRDSILLSTSRRLRWNARRAWPSKPTRIDQLLLWTWPDA